MYGIAGLLAGRTLAGRYLVEAVIGRGGMGAVYRATDERLSRHVAVKVVGAVTTDPGEHQRLRARFFREARAAAALRHANVVQVHDFGTDPELDLDFLVMELLGGEDLAARLMRAGPPPLATSLSILRQAARGLAAGHRAGVVHRDVKPGNLFLETEDAGEAVHVRVLDFGIAQVADDNGTVTQLTVYGRSPFSPAYASPEQLRGDDHITPASDVFSLAAVGYHLVTGTRPFTSSDPARARDEVADAVRLLRPRAPALGDAAHAVLVRALSASPGERFADAAQMADALSGVAASSASFASPATGPAVAVPSFPAAAAIGAPPTYVRSTPAVSPRPAAADETRVYAPEPARPVPPRQVPAQAVFAPPQPTYVLPPAYAPAPLRDAPANASPRTADEAQAQARPSLLGRFVRAAWELTLTTASVALFVGAWAAAIWSLVEGRPHRMLAGVVGTVLFTALAVHRLTGGRGRYAYAVAGAAAATAAGWRVVMRGGGDPAIALAAVFGCQVFACFVMSWLTRRKEAPAAEALPASSRAPDG